MAVGQDIAVSDAGWTLGEDTPDMCAEPVERVSYLAPAARTLAGMAVNQDMANRGAGCSDLPKRVFQDDAS